jgi:cell division septal protein FtsQ
MARYSTKLKQKQKPKKSMLPIWLALTGVALVLVAGFVYLSSKSPAEATVEVKGSASLKVDKEKIDHGELKLGDTVRDDITVTNVGDQPLRFAEAPFVEVKEGC